MNEPHLAEYYVWFFEKWMEINFPNGLDDQIEEKESE